MGERSIENLESLDGAASKSEARVDVVPVKLPAPPEPVEINYPDPTVLSTIVRDVARWSGRNFVMEPGVNAKLQIFAPRKLPPQKAYDLFITSLSVVGLRAVQVGEVVKIVPVQVVVVA
jgi:general secretion pathway protein D